MKGTKSQKGITLVALIITIVVLLILAVAAINTITNENIIGDAKKAVTEHNKSVKNEVDKIKDTESWLKGQLNDIGNKEKKLWCKLLGRRWTNNDYSPNNCIRRNDMERMV